MVSQVVQSEGKTSWEDLFRQDNGQYQAVAVLGFVAGHGCDLLDSRDRKGRTRNGFFTASTFEMSGLTRLAGASPLD